MRYGLSISLLAAAFALVVLGLSPDTALAQDETIDACLHSSSGVVYLPGDPEGTGEECANKDEELSWNKQGPPGPQGDPGPTGPPGIVDLNVVQEHGSLTSVSAGSIKHRGLEVHCSTDEKVLGGGGATAAVSIDGASVALDPGPTLVSSRPLTSPSQGWQIIYRLDNRDGDETATTRIIAYAVCAELSS